MAETAASQFLGCQPTPAPNQRQPGASPPRPLVWHTYGDRYEIAG